MKSVSFEYLVEYLTNGESQPIIPHFGDGPTHVLTQIRQQIIDSLDSVLEQLAAKLKRYLPQALEGDVTTVFANVDDYFNRKLRG